MRFWPRLPVVLAVVLLLGGSLAACGSDGSSPEETVQGAIKAMADRDAGKMASYFVEDMREQLEQEMELAFGMIDEIKISNIETRVISESGNTSTVELEFDAEVTAFGSTESEHIDDTADLVKVDGKWLIHGEALYE